MIEKLSTLWPEICLFFTTCVVMIIGLSPSRELRSMCGMVAGFGLLIAGILAINFPGDTSGLLPMLGPYAKAMVAGVGLMLVLVLAGTVDRREEKLLAEGNARFDALRLNKAEFYSFFLFSFTGLMLTASADDLIWLFLALELTSLPTYVMVTISTRGTRSQESGVKYFFLGALGAAIFLYGFALLYGGTGTTDLSGIRDAIAVQAASEAGMNPIVIAGLVMSVLGIGFKIAAVPMHAYTADVYQGAAAPVSAMLAFVPKTAGFLALILICSTAGWGYGLDPDGGYGYVGGDSGQLPEFLRVLLWTMAAVTMTVGNVLALVQTSVKRMLAYSSIAHSGYLLVGLVAGPALGGDATESGIAAILFYLLMYGVTNLGAFAVVACLERARASTVIGEEGEYDEIDDLDDYRGLCRTRPVLGWCMVISALGLLGLPPLLGFWAKLLLFTSGISAGEIALVVVLGLNSAIAAFYYLRLVALPLLEEPEGDHPVTPFPSRSLAAVASAAAIVGLVFVADPLIDAAGRAATITPLDPAALLPLNDALGDPAGHGGHGGHTGPSPAANGSTVVTEP